MGAALLNKKEEKDTSPLPISNIRSKETHITVNQPILELCVLLLPILGSESTYNVNDNARLSN